MARVEYLRYIMSVMLSVTLMALPVYAEGRLYQEVPHAKCMESNGFTTYDITRTGDGFIWFATDHGLIRFDGEHSKKIDLPHTGTGEMSVKALTQAQGGGLIAATTSGLFRIETSGQGHFIRQLLDGTVFPATCALWIPDKLSLVGGDEGIIAFTSDGKSHRIVAGQDMLDLSNKVVDMAAGNEGAYLLTHGGVFFLNVDNMKVKSVGDSAMVETLSGTSIAATDKYIYIGTSGNGIWKIDLSTGSVKEAFGFSKGNVVTSMKMHPDGSILYVGTDGGGITKIDVASEKIISNARHIASDPISPSSNQVYTLYTDMDDHLWVGYYQNGVDYTPSWTGPFELVDNPAVFNTRGVPVRALSISDGRITIGTREGITVFERNCSTAWCVKSPVLRSEMIISLLDHNGKTYIGTYGGGLQILDPKTRTVSNASTDGPHSVFKSGHIFSLAADKDGNLWGGTNYGLFKLKKNGEIKQYTSSNSGLPDGNVYGIFFDSEGKGWICTESGLCVYDPRQDKLRTDLFPSTFPRITRFRTVYEDSRRRLYFVPENGMVITSNMDLSDQKVIDHPLLDGVDAKGVVEDHAGNIWISSNRGIFRVDSHGHVARFGLASGLPSPSFLQGQPISDKEGHIWFGNSAGLLRLTESEIDQSIDAQRAPIPTIITVNGRQIDFVPQRENGDGSFHIDLDKSANTIKIDFSTFSYALEEPEAYVYSLDGGEWKRFAGELSLTLYELSPGKHEIKVKSANDTDGEDDLTTLKLHIPYPVWWYVLIGLVIALVLIPAFLWMYVAKRKVEKDAVSIEDEDIVEGAIAPISVAAEETSPRQKYASNTLTRNEAREIARKVEEVMETEKPYLQTNLKVGDLAAMVGISSHKLSQFFSQHKGHTFYDYVNKFRVEEFKRLVKDERNRSLTLSALAEMAGFSSRASFFRHFKNIEGISPGEYLKNGFDD